MDRVVLVVHVLCVVYLGGSGLVLGVLLPPVFAAVLEPEQRVHTWARLIDRSRGPAFGALGLLFVTGFLNISFLGTRPTGLLLLKMFLALGVAGQVVAQVGSVGQRLIRASERADGPDTSVVAPSVRALRRLAYGQTALAALILYISFAL